jgi:CDP-6-deoxy-D-xylo-4-hexulose-3-dehydrase
MCSDKGIVLIEDTCESHGATYEGQKCGSFADVSNFSFYYAHHMSTIEGGMICTKNKELYRMMRMIRSHGMLRECDDSEYIEDAVKKYPEVHREFIFPVPGFNMRSTEINAVIGLNQLKRLDENIRHRRDNYELFISHLDSQKYYTGFENEGNSNYAFVVMPADGNRELYNHMIEMYEKENVEFRRGTAGGGNMTRQPYIRKRFPNINPSDYKNAEYIHEFGVYIGNYPGLEKEKILKLCEKLNEL